MLSKQEDVGDSWLSIPLLLHKKKTKQIVDLMMCRRTNTRRGSTNQFFIIM